MTDKMTLLCVNKTGHILGFVTRESDPETKLQPQELAGETLLVRFIGDPTVTAFKTAQFLVPASDLSVEIKSYDDVVVTRPRDFCLDASKQVVSAVAVNPTVTLAGNRVSVDVVSNVTAKTAVWIQVSSAIDPSNTQTRDAEIPLNEKIANFDLLPLDVGKHNVLVMVAGRQPSLKEITVP